MTLRITLLVLVTGLFTLVWTSDRAARRPVGQSQAKSRASQPVLLAQATFQAASAPAGEIPMDDLWMFGGCEMPLPAGLAAGEYRVVSNRGQVRELTVAADDLRLYHQQENGLSPQAVYQTQAGPERWYFIRVEPFAGSVPALADDTPTPRPAVANRGWHAHRPAVAQRDEPWRARQKAGKILLRTGEKLSRRLSLVFRGENPAPVHRLSGLIRQAQGLNGRWSLMAEEMGHSLRRIKWTSQLATQDPAGQRL